MVRVHFLTNLLVSQMQQEAFLSSCWFHLPTLFWLQKMAISPNSHLSCHLHTRHLRCLVQAASCCVTGWSTPKLGWRISWAGKDPLDAPGSNISKRSHARVYTSSGCVWVHTYEIGGYMPVQVCGILGKRMSRNLCDAS